MADFKAKMHQIRFRLGLCPRPCWGSLQCSPRPPSCDALLLRGRAKGRGEEEKGREGRGKECVPPPLQSYFDHWTHVKHLYHKLSQCHKMTWAVTAQSTSDDETEWWTSQWRQRRPCSDFTDMLRRLITCRIIIIIIINTKQSTWDCLISYISSFTCTGMCDTTWTPVQRHIGLPPLYCSWN